MTKRTRRKKIKSAERSGPDVNAVARFREKHGGDSCGDDVAERLAKLKNNHDKLRRLATANSVWDAKYERTPNWGLVRMAVGNRLRALVRKGETVKWGK